MRSSDEFKLVPYIPPMRFQIRLLFKRLICMLCIALVVSQPAYTQSLPIVVIDPGHGGHDPGAVTAKGLAEKDITLTFAKSLKAEIEASGFAEVILTRTSDIFLPIDSRVDIARKHNANLMISLHADSLGANPFGIVRTGPEVAGSVPEVRGATLYTLSETASDSESAAYAERENNADQMTQFSGGGSQVEVNDILAELTMRETRALSTHFANLLLAHIKPNMRLTKFPLRSARFRVLRAPDVPSILLEMGYLSSEEDAKLLTSGAWRQASVRSVATAIQVFISGGASTARADLPQPDCPQTNCVKKQ